MAGGRKLLSKTGTTNHATRQSLHQSSNLPPSTCSHGRATKSKDPPPFISIFHAFYHLPLRLPTTSDMIQLRGEKSLHSPINFFTPFRQFPGKQKHDFLSCPVIPLFSFFSSPLFSPLYLNVPSISSFYPFFSTCSCSLFFAVSSLTNVFSLQETTLQSLMQTHSRILMQYLIQIHECYGVTRHNVQSCAQDLEGLDD